MPVLRRLLPLLLLLPLAMATAPASDPVADETTVLRSVPIPGLCHDPRIDLVALDVSQDENVVELRAVVRDATATAPACLGARLPDPLVTAFQFTTTTDAQGLRLSMLFYPDDPLWGCYGTVLQFPDAKQAPCFGEMTTDGNEVLWRFDAKGTVLVNGGGARGYDLTGQTYGWTASSVRRAVQDNVLVLDMGQGPRFTVA